MGFLRGSPVRAKYPQALPAATPSADPALRDRRVAVKGELPSPLNPPPGCACATRCPHATAGAGGALGGLP